MILVIGFGFLAVYLLMLNANSGEKNNAFVRKIKDPKLKVLHMFEFPDKTFEFSPGSGSKIKLNRYADKLNLYEIDYGLTKLDTIVIRYPILFNSKAVNIYKDIFQSTVLCTNLYGDILKSSGTQSEVLKLTSFTFDRFKAISPHTIIARGRYPHGKNDNRSITKISITDSVKLEKEYVLPNLANGIFANEGHLYYDRENARVFYMYYYRGEFLSLDTNLNLLYKSKTIDTVLTADITTKVKTDVKENKRVIMQTKPPKVVNAFITADKNQIYIRSRLKADNDTELKFADNSVIDTYDSTTGKYRNSFYLPRYRGIKVSDFQVKGDTLLAIYGKYLVKYSMDEH
ncbi:hypothetical protein SAMN05443550_110189 [Pedobacter hartonius]|uniref:Uncharacterized protein n=2 Tax=Pedobacter hartonius TaxID=425514 RepID=A0A1H4GLS2_9SPHI|nr:hypothetical protein SAMN05443550_110189 [Pedobacter hartonius]